MTKKKPKPPSQTPFAVWMRIVRFLWRHLPAIVVALALLAIYLFSVRPAKGETVTVSTYAATTQALCTTQPDLNIVLSGTIKVEKTLTIPETIKTFRMVGDKQSSGLSFKALPIDVATNGVEINAANASLFGFTVSDFQPSGAATKFNGSGVGTFSHLTYSNVSTSYVRSTTQPIDATGVHYGHCITSHGTSAALIVDNCTFRRCCWSSAEYSSCVYAHVPVIVITDNTFDQVAGSVLQLYGSVLSAGNTMKNGVLAPTRSETMQAPAWAYIPGDTNATYIRNPLSGDLRATYYGHQDAGDLVKP